MVFLRILLLTAACANASELLLVAITDPYCHFCEKWQDEVAVQYDLIRQTHGFPELMELQQNSYKNRTWVYKHLGFLEGLPTFVIMDGDQVVGSFVGYTTPQDFIDEVGVIMRDVE